MRVARDKGHSIVSPANRSAAPKNLHRAESGPHGLSAWQTRGPNLLGPNNGTEFKRCISRASPGLLFILIVTDYSSLWPGDCLLRRVMTEQSLGWRLHLRSPLLALFTLDNKVAALARPAAVNRKSGEQNRWKRHKWEMVAPCVG